MEYLLAFGALTWPSFTHTITPEETLRQLQQQIIDSQRRTIGYLTESNELLKRQLGLDKPPLRIEGKGWALPVQDPLLNGTEWTEPQPK